MWHLALSAWQRDRVADGIGALCGEDGIDDLSGSLIEFVHVVRRLHQLLFVRRCE